MSDSSPTTMKAPPSAYQIIQIPEPYADVIQRRGLPGGKYVKAEDSPWVPFGDNAAIRHLAFDVRNNIASNILWVKSGGVIGTHRHRGTVVMVCLEGSVRYLEYDWVAGPGDFIYEPPGITHTLVSDHPQGVKLFGWLQGPIEFYDEHANLIETVDVWWYIHHYESYCRAHGIPINEEMFI